MKRQISELHDNYIICGFGRMGQLLSHELQHHGRPVVVVEKDANLQTDATKRGFMMFVGNATEEDVLTAVGIERAKCLVSALPSDAENVFITLTARNLNPKLQIISRAELQSTEKKLRQAGASRVVMPTVVGARQMARMITHPATADLMDLVAQSGFEDLELDEIAISQAPSLAGITLKQTEAWRKHKLLVVAVKRIDGQYSFNPNGGDSFEAGDIVVVMGHGKDIERFRNEHVG